jgi:YidC/Oxa1 family membrane protein insertase
LPDFQNPQQEPGMQRRLLLVFALTFVVILASQPLLKKYLPQSSETPAPAQQQAQQQKPESVTTAPPPVAAPAAGVTEQAAAEATTVIENNVFKITFSNRGGLVKSWILKKFDDDKGRPLEMVHSVAAAKYGFPLSMWTWDEAQRNKLNSVLYVPSASGTLASPGELTFD